MMHNNFQYYWWGPWIPFFGIGFFLLVLWNFFWKGLALWHSGRRGQYWWFVIVLVVSTAGILEIIYLFAIAKLKFDQLFTMGVPGEPPQDNKI